ARAARATRQAISPRLAMSSLWNTPARLRYVEKAAQHTPRQAGVAHVDPALHARLTCARSGHGKGMAKAMRHAQGGRRRRTRATVVDLSSVREARRRELAERRVRSVMDGNRAALTRLFASGLIFTQKGSRAGRELLREHQTLQKLVD